MMDNENFLRVDTDKRIPFSFVANVIAYMELDGTINPHVAKFKTPKLPGVPSVKIEAYYKGVNHVVIEVVE